MSPPIRIATIIGLILVLILFWAGWLLLDQDAVDVSDASPDQSGNQDISELSDSNDGHEAGSSARYSREFEQFPSEAPDDETSPLLDAVSEVENATTAVDASRALTDLAALNFELAERRLSEIRVLCLPNRPVSSADSRTIEEELEEYCEGFDHDEWELISGPGEEAAIARARDTIIDRLAVDAAMSRVADDEASDFFTGLVQSAETPERLFDLLDYNEMSAVSSGGEPVWNLGKDEWIQHFPEADLIEAQRVAILLYKCQRFGGCGARHYFRFVYCQTFLMGRCLPGTSVQEMLFQTTPPVTYSLALEILASI